MKGVAVTIYPLSQEIVDRVGGEGLISFVFEKDRPPVGVAGWVDWRFHYRMSNCLLRSWFTGNCGELLLIPSQGRISSKWVMLVGLGDFEKFDAAVAETVSGVVWKEVERLKWRELAVGLPPAQRGHGSLRVSSVEFMKIFLKARLALSSASEQLKGISILEDSGQLEKERILFQAPQLAAATCSQIFVKEALQGDVRPVVK